MKGRVRKAETQRYMRVIRTLIFIDLVAWVLALFFLVEGESVAAGVLGIMAVLIGVGAAGLEPKGLKDWED